MIEILLILGGSAVGVGGGYLIAKKINDANYSIFIEQAKAKAKAIEFEAEGILKDAKLSVQEAEFAAKKRYEDKVLEIKKEFDLKGIELEKHEASLKNKEQSLDKSAKKLEDEQKRANELYEESQSLKRNYEAKIEEALKVLEHSAGLTEVEAREEILKRVEEKSRGDIAHIVRRYEEEAKREAKKKANYIIAQATTRFAGEYAAERLINVVDIKNDDLKGRIIGKDGRNIKTLEMVLGVDVIIDDTPHAVILSSFNLYRRAIATKVVELLVEDGRIHPARIEEIHEKVSKEFEDSILEEGENIAMDLGLNGIHPELLKLIGKLKFRASYGQNALAHSLEVAHLAGIIAAETGGDANLAKRAGLLHDIGKALTQDYEGSHVDLGADICRRYKEHPVVINAIYAHHGHEEAETVECAAVCTADALSAARPGARREVLESFLRRVSEIEEIATSKHGVKQAYAINAGREVRVIANANLVNDDEAILVAKEIAEDIEKTVQYPGEIKVSVIRETRATHYAK
ncbi:MAG: ribonuclease Y [Campylobacteraceae bacterium]|nr:ribonuclease Y [Campylobacteraceae bacterium]